MLFSVCLLGDILYTRKPFLHELSEISFMDRSCQYGLWNIFSHPVWYHRQDIFSNIFATVNMYVVLFLCTIDSYEVHYLHPLILLLIFYWLEILSILLSMIDSLLCSTILNLVVSLSFGLCRILNFNLGFFLWHIQFFVWNWNQCYF